MENLTAIAERIIIRMNKKNIYGAKEEYYLHILTILTIDVNLEDLIR